jgi:hypothetical protein
VLNKQLAPLNPRRCVLDPDAEANALGLRAFQDAAWRGDGSGITEGQIGRKLGFDFFTDQAVPTHTTGAATAGTIALDDTIARAVGIKTLHMDGFSTKPFVGDVFTSAGDAQTYVVTGATDLAGTDSDISFLPGLKVVPLDAHPAAHVFLGRMFIYKSAIPRPPQKSLNAAQPMPAAPPREAGSHAQRGRRAVRLRTPTPSSTRRREAHLRRHWLRLRASRVTSPVNLRRARLL